MDASYLIENQIDALRTSLRAQNTIDVDEGKYTFAVGTIYIDLVRECEKCGDYILNVVESKIGKRENQSVLDELQIDIDKKKVTIAGETVDFTRTEFEILSLLVSNPGRLFSRQELLESIWPKDVAKGTRVVDQDIRSIRFKLGELATHISSLTEGYIFQ